jgi:hypothetical protein
MDSFWPETAGLVECVTSVFCIYRNPFDSNNSISQSTKTRTRALR